MCNGNNNNKNEIMKNEEEFVLGGVKIIFFFELIEYYWVNMYTRDVIIQFIELLKRMVSPFYLFLFSFTFSVFLHFNQLANNFFSFRIFWAIPLCNGNILLCWCRFSCQWFLSIAQIYIHTPQIVKNDKKFYLFI